MLEGICICFYKAIVQSMFKHVASENGPLVLQLQSYSKIFILLTLSYPGGGGVKYVSPPVFPPQS